jgi:hypothetical protein
MDYMTLFREKNSGENLQYPHNDIGINRLYYDLHSGIIRYINELKTRNLRSILQNHIFFEQGQMLSFRILRVQPISGLYGASLGRRAGYMRHARLQCRVK